MSWGSLLRSTRPDRLHGSVTSPKVPYPARGRRIAQCCTAAMAFERLVVKYRPQLDKETVSGIAPGQVSRSRNPACILLHHLPPRLQYHVLAPFLEQRRSLSLAAAPAALRLLSFGRLNGASIARPCLRHPLFPLPIRILHLLQPRAEIVAGDQIFMLRRLLCACTVTTTRTWSGARRRRRRPERRGSLHLVASLAPVARERPAQPSPADPPTWLNLPSRSTFSQHACTLAPLRSRSHSMSRRRSWGNMLATVSIFSGGTACLCWRRALRFADEPG